MREEKKKKDKTQYTFTNREKRIIRRIKHNTHVQREGREKEGGENTIHAYKRRQELKKMDQTQYTRIKRRKRNR